MSAQSVITWVIAITAKLRFSQSQTQALIVAAAVQLERVNLA